MRNVPLGSAGRAILERNLDIRNTENGGSAGTPAHNNLGRFYLSWGHYFRSGRYLLRRRGLRWRRRRESCGLVDLIRRRIIPFIVRVLIGELPPRVLLCFSDTPSTPARARTTTSSRASCISRTKGAASTKLTIE